MERARLGPMTLGRLNRQAQKMEKNQQFPVFGDSWFLLFWEGERATPDRKGGET